MNRSIRIAALATFSAALSLPVFAQTVKVTPLGGIDGEFCPQDRALIFEDPNGTRVLYDPGRTVAGATDPRLGKIDIILVSHMRKLSLCGPPTMRCTWTDRVESPISSLSGTARKDGLRTALAMASGRMRLSRAKARSKKGTLSAWVTMVAPSATAARRPPA